MAGKNIGKLSIRVLPDTTLFRADLQKLIKRIESSMSVNLKVLADTREAELQIKKFRNREQAKTVNMRVAANTLVAKAQMAALSRDRFTTLFVRVNKASLAKATSMLLALSGARLANKVLADLNRTLSKIDLNIPKIARVASAIALITAATLTASAGLVTVIGDLVKMGNVGLVLPAMLAGLVTGIVTLALALKDSKKQLAELGPAMHALQDDISAKFWDKAKEPIIDFVQSILPQLRAGFATTATALGNQAAALAGAFKETFANGVLEAMFDRLAETMDIVTTGARGFAEAITTLGTVGSNYLPRLATWVVKIGDGFNTWLQDAAVSGRLDAFIEDGIAQMKLFGQAVSGFVGILRGIDSAAAAAGGTGLKSFADNLSGAAALIQSSPVQAAITAMLKGADKGLSGLGEGIRAFGRTIVEIGPEIGTVFTLAGGAIGGLLAAISEALTQPAFKDGLIGFFTGIKAGMDALGPAMGPLFEFVGQLGTTIGVLAANIGPLLAVIKTTFAPLLDSILEAVTPLIPLLAGALTGAIAGLGPVIQGLSGFIRENEGFIQGLILAILGIALAVKAVQFGSMIAGLASAVVRWGLLTKAMIANKAQTVAIMALYAKDMAVALAKTVVGLVTATGAWIANTAAQIASKVALVAGAIASGVATAAQYALNLAMSLNPIGIIIAAIAALVAGLIWFFTQTELGQEIWANFTRFLGEAWTNIVTVATTVFSALGTFFSDLWTGIVTFITTRVQAIMTVITTVVSVIVALWNAYWAMVGAVITTVWNTIVAFVTGTINRVMSVISAVMSTIASVWRSIWAGIRAVVDTVWNGIMATINGIVGAIKNAVSGVMNTVSTVKNTIVGFFSGAGQWLIDAGKSMIGGLINGIKKMIGAARNAAAGVMDAISGFFPKSPAKEGPFSGRGWTLYSGQALGEGLADGMESSVSKVRRSALSMMNAASGTARMNLADAETTATARGAVGEGDSIIIQGNVGYDPRAIAEELSRKKRQAAMLAGLRTVAVA